MSAAAPRSAPVRFSRSREKGSDLFCLRALEYIDRLGGRLHQDLAAFLREIGFGAVYLNRYLNVSRRGCRLAREPTVAPVELRRAFLDACDRQQQIAETARLAASHLAAGRPPSDFIAVLGHAVLREDAGFHMVQNLQAAVRQCFAWQGDPEVEPILIAAARYLAAHSPTSRARHQTAQVARRLMRGGEVHEDASEVAML
jgi:hypothetical protein